MLVVVAAPTCQAAILHVHAKRRKGNMGTLTNRWIYYACRLQLANVSRGAGIQLSSYNIGPLYIYTHTYCSVAVRRISYSVTTLSYDNYYTNL